MADSCALDGSWTWIYQLLLQMQGKTFYRLPMMDLQRKRWLQMRKLACPPAAGSGRDHFSDSDYKTKDVCDEHGQTVSVKMSFLVKDTVPS